VKKKRDGQTARKTDVNPLEDKLKHAILPARVFDNLLLARRASTGHVKRIYADCLSCDNASRTGTSPRASKNGTQLSQRQWIWE
jgi:hypothetical protein